MYSNPVGPSRERLENKSHLASTRAICNMECLRSKFIIALCSFQTCGQRAKIFLNNLLHKMYCLRTSTLHALLLRVMFGS